MPTGIARIGRVLGMLFTFLPRSFGILRGLGVFVLFFVGAELAASWIEAFPEHWITKAAVALAVVLVALFANSIELLKRLDQATGPTVKVGTPRTSFHPVLNFSGLPGRSHRAENALEIRVPIDVWNGEPHEIKLDRPHLRLFERRRLRRREVGKVESSGWHVERGFSPGPRLRIPPHDYVTVDMGITVSGLGDLADIGAKRLYVEVAAPVGLDKRERFVKRLRTPPP